MTVYAITDTKKGRTWIAPTYLQTTLYLFSQTTLCGFSLGLLTALSGWSESTKAWSRTSLERDKSSQSMQASRAPGIPTPARLALKSTRPACPDHNVNLHKVRPHSVILDFNRGPATVAFKRHYFSIQPTVTDYRGQSDPNGSPRN